MIFNAPYIITEIPVAVLIRNLSYHCLVNADGL